MSCCKQKRGVDAVQVKDLWWVPGGTRKLRSAGAVSGSLVIWGVLLLALGTAPAPLARTLLSREEALELVFPDAQVQRHTAYLDESQIDKVRRLCGPRVEVTRAMVPYYVAHRHEKLLGVAYFDSHIVRTQVETVMIAVDPAGQIQRIEILSFSEPPDYQPRPAWLQQFRGRRLDEDLALKRAIHPLTGASLTARAITRAARRTLAYHQIIRPEGAVGPKKAPGPGRSQVPPRRRKP